MFLELWQLVYIFIIGLVLALLEIEIEGPNGWAKNLPTKRIKFWWSEKLGKELTGYHTALVCLLLLFFHLPMVLDLNFSWQKELLILTQYLYFVVYWDFLWFVLNPNFRLKDFKKGGVPWHSTWFLKAPTEYWILAVMAVIVPGIIYGWHASIVQLYYVAVYAGLTIFTIIVFSVFYREKL